MYFADAIFPKGVKLRRFDDFDALREDILDRVKTTYESKFPLENDRYSIELKDLRYPEKKFDVRDEKDALIKGQSLTYPLFGKIILKDKQTKQVLDEQQGVIARVPYPTHRGTYINNGNEYSVVAAQERLKPGVYGRRKENGELESHINVAARTGREMRLFMEPETGVYRVMVGKSRIKLYPVMKGLGVSDDEMAKWWGPEVLELNKDQKEDTKSFDKFYSKFMGRRANSELSQKEKALEVLDEMSKAGLDEEVTQRTLGFAQKNVTPTTLLRATQKLLNIHKGDEEEDERDSVANKMFLDQSDLMAERITKDAGGLLRKLLSRSSYNKKITGFINGYFTPQLEGLVAGNSLANHIDGINPLQIMDFGYRVVQTGEGAIGDPDAIPMSARALHPSRAMAMDPIKTPDGGGVGIDQRFAIATLKGSDGNIYMPLKNAKTGKIEYLTPAQMSQKVIGFPKPKRHYSDEAPPVSSTPSVSPVVAAITSPVSSPAVEQAPVYDPPVVEEEKQASGFLLKKEDRYKKLRSTFLGSTTKYPTT